MNAKRDPVVFLLWGSQAIRKAAKVQIGDHHLVIRSAHPAARGRTKETRFMCCQHFSEASKFLEADPDDAMNWDLTAEPNGQQSSDAKREL